MRAARFASRSGDLRQTRNYQRQYFIPQQSDTELGIDAADTFIYMRGYPSKEERDKRLREAQSDPEFREVVIAQERDPDAKLIIKAHNIDMMPSGSFTAIKITQ
jgi:hypothetical protein